MYNIPRCFHIYYISTHFLTSQPTLIKLDNENIGGHLTPLHIDRQTDRPWSYTHKQTDRQTDHGASRPSTLHSTENFVSDARRCIQLTLNMQHTTHRADSHTACQRTRHTGQTHILCVSVHHTLGRLTYRVSAYTTHRADSHTVCQRTISINSLSVFTLTYNYQTSRARQSPTYLDVNGQHDLLVLAVVACHPIDRLWNKLQHKVEIDFIFLFTTQTNVSRIHNIALLHSHHF